MKLLLCDDGCWSLWLHDVYVPVVHTEKEINKCYPDGRRSQMRDKLLVYLFAILIKQRDETLPGRLERIRGH